MSAIEQKLADKNVIEAIRIARDESPLLAAILTTVNHLDCIRVKLLSNWASPEQLTRLWWKMAQEDGRWNRIKLVLTEPIDYYVIINAVSDDEKYDPRKTIVFRMEPRMAQNPQQWGKWADPDDKQFVKVCRHEQEYNNCEWHLSKTFQQLNNEKIVKNDQYSAVVSAILSAKYSDPGHVKRVDFVKYLDSRGVTVHVYGSNRFGYQHYRGPLPYHNKDNGLLPYKYSFNVENHSEKNYFTEKLIDGILSECLTFYSGCFNAFEYIDPRAYVYLHLSNFDADCQTIQTALREDWHSQRLPYIRQAKKTILHSLQFFPRLERIIKTAQNEQKD